MGRFKGRSRFDIQTFRFWHLDLLVGDELSNPGKIGKIRIENKMVRR
jgi:hypothetical protein